MVADTKDPSSEESILRLIESEIHCPQENSDQLGFFFFFLVFYDIKWVCFVDEKEEKN